MKLHYQSTLWNDKPDALLGPERAINHDHWVTNNNEVHDRKLYRDERDFQPKHPQAPSNQRLHLVRPDWHRKVLIIKTFLERLDLI